MFEMMNRVAMESKRLAFGAYKDKVVKMLRKEQE